MSQTKAADLFLIEYKLPDSSLWERFSANPIAGRENAEANLRQILELSHENEKKPDDPTRRVIDKDIRIVPYSVQHELWDVVCEMYNALNYWVLIEGSLSAARQLVLSRPPETAQEDIRLLRKLIRDVSPLRAEILKLEESLTQLDAAPLKEGDVEEYKRILGRLVMLRETWKEELKNDSVCP